MPIGCRGVCWAWEREHGTWRAGESCQVNVSDEHSVKAVWKGLLLCTNYMERLQPGVFGRRRNMAEDLPALHTYLAPFLLHATSLCIISASVTCLLCCPRFLPTCRAWPSTLPPLCTRHSLCCPCPLPMQGLPVDHTIAAWPLVGPGVHQHRGKSLKDSDTDIRERARFALIGNAVTVQVHGLPGCMAAWLHGYMRCMVAFAVQMHGCIGGWGGMSARTHYHPCSPDSGQTGTRLSTVHELSSHASV